MIDEYNVEFQYYNKKECCMELAKQILAWKKAKIDLVHNDVLNFLIDANLITAEEMKTLVENFKKNPITPEIPKNYMDD